MKNHNSVWQKLMLSLIVAIDCSLMASVNAVMILIGMWADFLVKAKNIGRLIGSKAITTIFVQNYMYVGNTKEE